MIIKTREQAIRLITIVVSVTFLVAGLVFMFMPKEAHRIMWTLGGLSLVMAGLYALARPKEARRAGAILLGGVMLLAGAIMVVTPGPGIPFLLGGLALLASEFVWARRLLERFKQGAAQVKNAVIGKRPNNGGPREKAGEPANKECERMNEKPSDNFVVLVNKEGMGHAAPELQTKLLGTYMKLLVENGTLPKAVCFYTEGVKLVVEGSPVLEQLHQLEAKGVHLIICQTCLNYYNLREKVKVGIIGGMGDILAAQMLAEKVITL